MTGENRSLGIPNGIKSYSSIKTEGAEYPQTKGNYDVYV